MKGEWCDYDNKKMCQEGVCSDCQIYLDRNNNINMTLISNEDTVSYEKRQEQNRCHVEIHKNLIRRLRKEPSLKTEYDIMHNETNNDPQYIFKRKDIKESREYPTNRVLVERALYKYFQYKDIIESRRL